MTNLTTLRLHLECEMSGPLKIAWSLPLLQRMSLVYTHSFRQPFEFVRIHAPKLLYIYCDSPFDRELASLLFALNQLQDIVVRGSVQDDHVGDLCEKVLSVLGCV